MAGSVAVSTGKCAAQAAHGLMLWALTLSRADAARWVWDGARFNVAQDAATFDAVSAASGVRVRDLGLTEIAAGSLTVACGAL